MKGAGLIAVVAGMLLTAEAAVIHLSGTIVNQHELPMTGLVVELLDAGMVDTTDTAGTFLFVADDIVGSRPLRALREAPPRVAGGQLIVPVPSPARRLVVALYDLEGAVIDRQRREPPGNGWLRVPLVLPARASSMLILEIRCGEDRARFMLLNHRSTCGAVLRSLDGGEASGSAPAKTRASVDRLAVSRRDSLEALVDVDDYVDELSLVMDFVPREVIEIAMAEVGRGPGEVGEDLDHEPHDLGQYLDTRNGRYEAWCSEFVSWAYRAGGYPLSSRWEPDWMLGGSTSLRTWYRNRGRWVSHEEPGWDTFVPAPGDYVRYDNAYGGHSGLVRYVSEDGGTLYTVEGNVGNSVRSLGKTRWRDYDVRHIDGFGRMSGFLKPVP